MKTVLPVTNLKGLVTSSSSADMVKALPWYTSDFTPGTSYRWGVVQNDTT